MRKRVLALLAASLSVPTPSWTPLHTVGSVLSCATVFFWRVLVCASVPVLLHAHLCLCMSLVHGNHLRCMRLKANIHLGMPLKASIHLRMHMVPAAREARQSPSCRSHWSCQDAIAFCLHRCTELFECQRHGCHCNMSGTTQGRSAEPPRWQAKQTNQHCHRHSHMYTRLNAHTHTYAHTHTHICTHTHTYAHTHTKMRAYMCHVRQGAPVALVCGAAAGMYAGVRVRLLDGL